MVCASAIVKNPAPLLLLDRRTIESTLSLDDCIERVEQAFAAHDRGDGMRPKLMHFDVPRGEFHIKVGGIVAERTYVTLKLGGGFFDNQVRYDLPNIIGLIVLADGETGAPLAVMESGYITRVRTGAATAVAAKFLARADSKTATICGAGAQGEIQLRALTRVLPIERAFVWNRTPRPEFANRLARDLNLDVQLALDLPSATQVSDVIVTCTPARHWYLAREYVRAGTFIAAVGADSPEKQELEPALMAASVVVCDLVEQAVKVGDVHHAIDTNLMRQDTIRGSLGAVIGGRVHGRVNLDDVIVFDSTGTAIQDATAAALVYERVCAEGRGEDFALYS
jgi:alanine dehydrogenase